MSIEVNDDTSPTFSAGSYCPSLKSNPYLMYFIDTFSLQRCLLYDSPGGKLYHWPTRLPTLWGYETGIMHFISLGSTFKVGSTLLKDSLWNTERLPTIFHAYNATQKYRAFNHHRWGFLWFRVPNRISGLTQAHFEAHSEDFLHPTTELSFLSNCTFCARAGYIGVYKKCSLIKMNHR